MIADVTDSGLLRAVNNFFGKVTEDSPTKPILKPKVKPSIIY